MIAFRESDEGGRERGYSADAPRARSSNEKEL